MFPVLNRLGPRLILSTAAFLLLLAGATALLVAQGFRQTQQAAAQRSSEGLEAQGQRSLADLAEREAVIMSARFDRAVAAGSEAAQIIIDLSQVATPAQPPELTRGPAGNRFDSRPDRRSDIVVFSFIPDSSTLTRDLRDSALLDAVLPAMLAKQPDAATMYYMNSQGMTRFVPPIGLHDLVPPEFDPRGEPFFAVAAPTNNPQRTTAWTPAYIDPAGLGAMVTASTPVYDGDEFRGVIGIDVTLATLIDRLNQLRPTESGYGFLMDRQGRLIAAAPAALGELLPGRPAAQNTITDTLGLDLVAEAPADLRGLLSEMQGGREGIARATLGGRPVFVAYSQLPNVGWSLGLVAPVSEVTALSSGITAAIRSGTDQTVTSTLLTMGIFFMLAILGMALLSRRLAQPIAALSKGTRAIAGGDLSVRLPVTSRDELGQLAMSFNQMAGELATSRDKLQNWNSELERTVTQRTAELAHATTEAEIARASAENANQLKTQFLANMSHELRTPLNSIINFTRIIIAGMRGPVTLEQVDYLERVRQSGEHLLGLINDILDLSKIESGRMELFKEPLALPELIAGVMSTAIGLTKDKSLTLHQEITPDLPTVEADRTRIRQVLLNLLSNAAKFTDEGTITVRAERVDREIVISVEDSGIGIAPENLEAVFEEFRQVDGSSNRRYEGTGLGLAICRRFIELHGGRIWATSVVGQGSTFAFTLPITNEPAPGLVLPSLDEPARQGEIVVVVVDDDLTSIEIVSTYLRIDGYQIHAINDSRTAISEIRRLRPAAIILDILMPHKDGWQVLSELKADDDLASIPVVLYSILEEQKLGFHLGASAFLMKPINENDLRGTVSGLVQPGARVLVVDDDPSSLAIATSYLEGAHYVVRTANGGATGLTEIGGWRPDLIVLDLMMPEVDGFAVLEELRRRGDATPVLVLTAKDLTSEDHAFLNHRVNALLLKGQTSQDALLQRVAQVLQRRPQIIADEG